VCGLPTKDCICFRSHAHSLINLFTNGGENIDPLENIFGKTAQMTVLKNLIENQNEQTYLSGIAKETGLSPSIVAKVITPLVLSGIVAEKPMGKIRTFRVNPESKAANLITDFFNEINNKMGKSEEVYCSH
jgi:predicted transcriptional regulator